MMLSEEQGIEIMDFIDEAWKNHICPGCCNKVGLSVKNRLFELREFNDGDLVVGGNQASLPVVAVTCNECGYVSLISAIQIGILK